MIRGILKAVVMGWVAKKFAQRGSRRPVVPADRPRP